ncbi:MAG: helix-turn-helix domain-containing protein [Acidimicrobiales bacterium]|nr:helix-turn-helix domain-containing protein [Acidimicrobiales bacterium]
MSEGKSRDLGGFIREQRRIAEMSLRRLSEVAGISNPYLSQIERGLRKPSAEILQQIARGLSISAETLYVQAGILDESSERSDLVAAIRSAPELNDLQKRALLEVYKSFVGSRLDLSEALPNDSQDLAPDQGED